MFAKGFFRDRLVIFSGLVATVLTLANILLVVAKVDLNEARVVFRHWLVEGNSQLYVAEPTYMYSFIGLAVLVLISSWVIGYRIYDSYRPAAYFALISSVVVLAANLMVVEVLL